MTEGAQAVKAAPKDVARVDGAKTQGITLTQEEYDALIRKSNVGGHTSISKEDLEKALDGNSLYGAAKALGKSYAAVKNAMEKYGISYTPVVRNNSGIKRKTKSYTLSEEEAPIVNAIVFALKNRPQKADAIKALAADCTKI